MTKTFRGSMTIELPNGERKRIFVRGKSQRDVDLKLAEIKTKYDMGLMITSPNTTFGKWADEWLETYKKPTVTNGWYKDIKSMLKNHLLPCLGGLQLNKIRPVHIQSCINGMSGRSYSLVNKAVVILKDILQRAVENGLILTNPAQSVIMPKTTKGERRGLTVDEEQRLLDVLADSHYGGFFGIMLACGLRVGEAMALTWFNVDMKNQTISITQAVENHSSNIKEPKTKAGFRTIPIPEWYLPYLNKPKTSQFVFTNTKNKMIRDDTMRKAWNKLTEQAMLSTEITPYYLRHTYATSLAEREVDMKTAQYLLGHSDIAVTAKVYTHVTDRMIETARNKINSINVKPPKVARK